MKFLRNEVIDAMVSKKVVVNTASVDPRETYSLSSSP